MTGAGGGALMTPMLILFFGVKPSTAISSDLVAAVLMRPVGAAVHMTKKTVNYSLVGWMVLGSVPAALFGAYALHLMGNSKSAEHNVQLLLGAALLIGAAAMVLRYGLDRRSGHRRQGLIGEVVVRPLPTVAIGAIGGFVVGMTSVGSGSLMIVLLLFLYPVLGANQLVGTDLTQAVPLTLAAALGALAFGHVEFAVTASIVVGSVPAVLVGSLISSRAPGPLHPPGHHVRHLRLGPQVRRRRHHGAGLDTRRRARGRRRRLARLRAAAAGRVGRRRLGGDAARRTRGVGTPRERVQPRHRGRDGAALVPPPGPPPREPGASGAIRGCGSRGSAARRSPAAPRPVPRPASGGCRRAPGR